MATQIVPIPVVYEKEKRHFVDTTTTFQNALEALKKQNVKGVQFVAKGNQIPKISIVAVQLEEETQNKYKITSMKSEYRTENDLKDGVDKQHIFLTVIVEKK